MQILATTLAGLSKMMVRSASATHNQMLSGLANILIISCCHSGKWIEFDDDNPSIRKEEEILKLSGGGKQLFS